MPATPAGGHMGGNHQPEHRHIPDEARTPEEHSGETLCGLRGQQRRIKQFPRFSWS